jgi:hypothetical protein
LGAAAAVNGVRPDVVENDRCIFSGRRELLPSACGEISQTNKTFCYNERWSAGALR